MAKRIYSEEFRVEAVKQVTKNGYSIVDTAQRLGVHPDSLSNWIKRLESPEAIQKHKILDESQAEIKKLQKELKRVTEERDILKKAAVYHPKMSRQGSVKNSVSI
jgi:transposase